MAPTGPGEHDGELDTVAKLVDLSETAPMPRIDGERPPLVTRRKPQPDPGGLYPDPAAAPASRRDGPGTKPQPAVGELPAGLDAMFTDEHAPRTETAPPPAPGRNTRYVALAGAVVVALAGFGTWALWPAPDSGSAGKPAEVPAAPTRSSSAPPAVTTMSASPTPPPASDQVDHTPVHTTEEKPQDPADDHPAPHTREQDPVSGAFSSAVSSYLQQWSSRHQQPTHHRRG
ncbi:hypothetical protein [Amycolatopsis sp. NPDC051903]|uniref:hypothetical protein n=1 Tax=Amycolatopsis sp. NPDC051903 TaxID=3363936 RepID=UPI00378B417B